MACGASNALDGLVALLEGAAGAAECHIDPDRFRRVDEPVKDLRAAPADRPLPFNIRRPRLASGPGERGDMTSGSRMRSEWRVEIAIAYPAKPHDELAAAKELLDDTTQLLAVLEYEPNVNGITYAGWTGCTVEDVIDEDVIDEDVTGGGDSPPLLRLLTVTLLLTAEDARTT